MPTTRRRNGHDDGDRKVQSRLSSLRGNIDALQDDMRGLVSDVGDAASEQAQSAVNGAIETAQGMRSRAETWGNQNIRNLRRSVRSQPLSACMLAIGAGALLGALFLRR